MASEKEKPAVFAEERKQQILEIIRKNQKIVVPELCSYFGVSASTIRNDLRDLTEAKLITRTHGGAISNSKVSLEPLPETKECHMHRQKAAIARQAAAMVDDGDIIALCTGTTTMELAKHLTEKKKLTIVLNDIRIAAFLEEHTDFTLFMLGGIIRRGFHYVNTSGNPLPRISIDKAFFSCNGLSAAMGATLPDYNLAVNTAEIIGLASEAVLLCDSSKIGTLAFAQIAPLEKIGTIIIDSDADPGDVRELGSCEGCQIIIAPVPPPVL
ncbi:DeoR/GlpR family DNA-binding transcription regulator [Breznakiella homolactica]|uniref:DeoR/GlpR transcriptional regulator n=1 Tax=Breznakiella homolactica TaxID=2798577 RepID=A0A7T7XRB5_9SPIR|nr:DeoR/GlpR family DNA-binding transcription regulator [Breznakiella homolactica]QQO11048.1 DeoR/GlpR family DNA-binding transcription regulator [Breznakiella homolactica]